MVNINISQSNISVIIPMLKVTYYPTRFECLLAISHCKPFRKSAASDITSGRVHLDVRWIDQPTSLPSGP